MLMTHDNMTDGEIRDIAAREKPPPFISKRAEDLKVLVLPS